MAWDRMTKKEMKKNFLNNNGSRNLLTVAGLMGFDHIDGVKLFLFTAATILSTDELLGKNSFTMDDMIDHLKNSYNISKEEFTTANNEEKQSEAEKIARLASS